MELFGRAAAFRSSQITGPRMLEYHDVALRLAAATGLGVALGINRDLADKPIGMRTLALVSLGSASAAVAGIQVPGMESNPDAMSRVVQGVIQGVMAGISFIGAGVILRNTEARSVEGLTTAATVWVAAALGIACGLAIWDTVIVGGILAIAIMSCAVLLEKLGLKKK
jgi:putative Mg2+ transporter-C (MgtC) family protein